MHNMCITYYVYNNNNNHITIIIIDCARPFSFARARIEEGLLLARPMTQLNQICLSHNALLVTCTDRMRAKLSLNICDSPTTMPSLICFISAEALVERLTAGSGQL